MMFKLFRQYELSCSAGKTWHPTVVGESYYQDALFTICGGYSRHGYEVEIDAILIPEPECPHDRNAIAVYIRRLKVGYIGRELAAQLAPMLKGRRVRIDARIVGGWRTNRFDIGHFGVQLAVNLIDEEHIVLPHKALNSINDGLPSPRKHPYKFRSRIKHRWFSGFRSAA